MKNMMTTKNLWFVMVMKQTYIVYMGELPEDRKSIMNAHHNILSEAIGE